MCSGKARSSTVADPAVQRTWSKVNALGGSLPSALGFLTCRRAIASRGKPTCVVLLNSPGKKGRPRSGICSSACNPEAYLDLPCAGVHLHDDTTPIRLLL